MIYNIVEFGAVGDGITNDSVAVQKAIDTCYENGGGRVYVPGGKVFKVGSILLKSYVELHLAAGSVLKASDTLDDFLPVEPGMELNSNASVPSYINCEYNGKPFHYFIYGKDAEYVSITGSGKIDGTEEVFHGEEGTYHIEGTYYPRIPMVLFENISQLTVKGVTMTKCGFWTLHMAGCQDVLIDGIRIINSLKMANSDGIDPDHCKNVRIVNCHIECADDCIVFKNTAGYEKYGSCENIVVSGCTLISTSAAIKFGTESVSDFKNIIVENCNISRSNRGISLQLRDGGNIENIIFSNINIETRRFSEQWWGRAEPIYVTAIDRKAGVKAGHIKNVTFKNINCKSENGIFISGSKNNYIEDVNFENIRLNLQKSSKWSVDSYDIRPCEGEGIIKGKVQGVYVDYAKALSFKNIKVTIDDSMKEYVDKNLEVRQAHSLVFEEA
jgi:polygalacturonase